MGCPTCKRCTNVEIRDGKPFIYCDYQKRWRDEWGSVDYMFYGPCLHDTTGSSDDDGTRPLTHEERIYSLIMYLKYDYCDDKINNYYYREYLTLLRDVTKDFLTKAKLDLMLYEIRDKRD